MVESMTEQEKFDQAMKKILSVSKQELQRRLEEEKRDKQKIKPRVPGDR
jgi:hypothetical protein